MDRTKNKIKSLPILRVRPVKSKPRVPGKGIPAVRPTDLNTQKRLEEISVLSQIAQSMAQVMELDELWPRLHREVNRLMDAGNFYVALWHRRENVVEFVYEIENSKLIPKSQKTWSHGLTEYVLTSGSPLLLKSLDEKRPGKRFKMLGKPARSWLGVPIRLKGQVLGMIAIQSYLQDGAYNTGHQKLLSAIAGYAAVTLENSRLHKAASQKAKEAEVLYQLSKAVVTDLDLDQLLQKIPKMIQDTFGYLNCAILLSDQENKYLYLKAAIGYRAEVIRNTRIQIGKQGITGWVAAEGKTIYIPDVSKEKRYLKTAKECRSEVALPLKSRNKVIGVLDIESSSMDGLRPDDIRLLENFANQAAAVIQKIRLEELAQQKIKEFSALSGIFQEFKVNMGLDSLTGELTKKIARALDSGKCLIALYNSKSGLLTGLPQGFSSKAMSAEQRKRFKNKAPSSIMKCNTWVSRGKCAILSVYEERIPTPNRGSPGKDLFITAGRGQSYPD